MTCEEFREVASVYVLGALDPDDREACEAHLAEVSSHRGCEEALRAARETVAALAEAVPGVRPDRSVWRAIEVRAGFAARARRPWTVAFGSAAAAAAVLFAALYARERSELRVSLAQTTQAERQAEVDREARDALFGEIRSLEATSIAARQILDLLGDPQSRVVPLASTAGRTHRAAAVLNVVAHRAVIFSSTLAPVPGKSYELWVLKGKGAPEPAGFLAGASGGLMVGSVDPALLASVPDAFAVSLEPEGGSPSPTQVLLVGKVAG